MTTLRRELVLPRTRGRAASGFFTFDFPVTVAIVVTAIVATTLHITGVGSSIVSVFLADREAIAGGQVWRLLTGPFVHQTWGHLVRDLIVVAVIGIGYEEPLRRILPALVVVSLVAPAAAVLAFQPELGGYLGLSGMSHAWIGAAVAYEIAVRPKGKRWLVAAVAIGFAIKLYYEQTAGPSVIPTSLGPGATPAPLAHAAGAISAALLVFSSKWSRRPSRRDDRELDRR